MTTFESYIHVPRTNDTCTFKLIVATTYISRVETSLNTLILVLLKTCLTKYDNGGIFVTSIRSSVTRNKWIAFILNSCYNFFSDQE